MGDQKFYESPAGRLRVELLLRSGEQFGTNTLEGRILRWHLETEALYRYSVKKWEHDRLVDLILVAGMEKVEQASSKKYEDTFRELSGTILDLIHPYRQQREEEERRKRKADEERAKYLEAIAKNGMKGYGSLKAIKESLSKIGKTVKEMSGK